MKTFLLTTTKIMAPSSGSAMDLVVHYFSFAIKKNNGCVSYLELVYTNTSAKRFANQAHQKFTGEDRQSAASRG